MHWNDEGFLLSKNKYSENSIIIEVFTLNHGRYTGIVYGGTSRKIKNYLQLGNKIHLDLKKKNENKIGYFKIEIIKPVSPFFFDNNKKIFCLFSALNLLRLLLPESQTYNSIYYLFSNFLEDLKSKENWIVHYIFWEINILKEIGYDLNLRSNLISGNNNKYNKLLVNIDNENVYIPSFLVENFTKNIDIASIYSALNFIGKFINRNILIPNNLKYPVTRQKLENFFK